MIKKSTLLIIFLIVVLPMSSTAADVPFQGLPRVTIQLADLDESGELICIGIDLAVFEEIDAVHGDLADANGDGKIFRVKDGKAKRFLTTSTNITIDLGLPSDYKKAVRHKLAMRTLYTPIGGNGEIIIADQNNGKDGWVEIAGSTFELSYFMPVTGDDHIIKHTDKWKENRMAYNESKVSHGIAPQGTELRSYSTFWSGERLLIEVNLNEPVEAVRVELYEDVSDTTATYSTTISSYTSNPDISGAAIYKGEIWSADMINKWGNYAPKTITVQMQAVVSGAAVETSYSTIIFDNKDQFYRITKVY